MNDWDDDDIIVDQLSDNEKKSLDLYKLASSKRAISNFVNIVTNESISVKFKERGDSYITEMLEEMMSSDYENLIKVFDKNFGSVVTLLR
jgi:hypothetical protein